MVVPPMGPFPVHGNLTAVPHAVPAWKGVLAPAARAELAAAEYHAAAQLLDPTAAPLATTSARPSVALPGRVPHRNGAG